MKNLQLTTAVVVCHAHTILWHLFTQVLTWLEFHFDGNPRIFLVLKLSIFWFKSRTTLLLNEGILRALKGKKLRLKDPMSLPWIFEFFLVFQIWGQNTFRGQFLEHCHLIWNCPRFLKRFLMWIYSSSATH